MRPAVAALALPITPRAVGRCGGGGIADVGRELSLNEECAVIESVKAASDIYSPVAGVITAVNESLNDNPALVNESPEADGWLWEMTLNDESGLAALMDGEAYAKFTAESQ